MKKVLALILTAVLLIACLSACESVHEHKTSEWKFNQTHHWRTTTCSLQACDFNMAPEEHVDGDEDYVCDVCEYKLHKHTGEYNYNEFSHQFVYTCGCPYPDIAELHIDTDQNGICDVCEYTLPPHEHTTEFVCDQKNHKIVYTCGCEHLNTTESHFDIDKNGFCDVCDYSLVHEHVTYFYYDKNVHSLYYLCQCEQTTISAHVDENKDDICDVCEYHTNITDDDVAQYVLNREELLKEEIETLQQEKPNYEYYYTPVTKVSCFFILHGGKSATEIVNQHQMRTLFEDAIISELNAIKMIGLIFERNDFTQEVHQKLVQIARDEAFIKTLSIPTERNFAQSYMPKIQSYAQNATPIEYQIENSNSRCFALDGNSYIIKTVQEYANYIDYLLQFARDEFETAAVEKQRTLYGEEFFEQNALIITRVIIRPSGSILLTVNNLYVSDNKAYVVIRTDEPVWGDASVLCANFTISVKKSLVQKVSEVITLE